MNNFWTTVGHTAGRRIASKAFIWSTIIVSILIIGLTNISNIIGVFTSDESDIRQQIAVIDETQDGMFASLLTSNEEGMFQYIEYTNGDLKKALEDARNEEHDYVLVVTGDPIDIKAEFYGSGTDYTIALDVHHDVQRVKETVATNELNLNTEELAIIYSPISFHELPLYENGEVQTQETHMQAYWMVYGLVFAIYLIVIVMGTMIATEVATEKSSRVMELIISSVNPVTQMLGKLVGIGLAGLVNLIPLLLAFFFGSWLSGNEFFETLFTDIIDPTLLSYVFILIILGYFVYGGIAAMLGALVSRAEDVNYAIQPLIVIAMIAFFLAIFGLNTPDSAIIQILSYVPFFTPQLLFLRIGMGTVPVWEVYVIIVILMVSAILINILAAKVYKGGVLMYGKFSFKEGFKQAFQLAKKEK
ncbi:ABC transporter permease [Alkalihalobacillus sp. LMS39]|uniref:ABC transporter permease n=1 Tax=Alkalihalobacillus sp. LMS39 TaxID=2924032 RepID=UPI001FB2A4C2|nr:ABC transporter permease [Alkalihalobacillus sp. LMS39]UOE96135.1 ABC transporter permease [Alkalihalobacillus sp. LMS39]